MMGLVITLFLVPTAGDEVRKCIVYILDNIIVLFYQQLYVILCL